MPDIAPPPDHCACTPDADRVADLHPQVQGYVAGFLIDADRDAVLLIRKRRPSWQAGRLNGVGGKIEAGETPAQAMRREFREEASLDISSWDHFLYLTFPAGAVWFFRAFADQRVLAAATAGTDEPLELCQIGDLLGPAAPIIANLRWILPLAAHRHDRYAPTFVSEIAGGALSS